MNEYQATLKREMLDEEYRYAYAEDFLNTFIATQIRVLREQRGLTQHELGNSIGTTQEGISRLENVNYSAWKTETLRKLARGLKVRLKVTFEDFTTLVKDANQFSKDNLKRVSFDEDKNFQESESKGEGLSEKIRETMSKGNKNEPTQLELILSTPKASVIPFHRIDNQPPPSGQESDEKGDPAYAAICGYSRASHAAR
jgi:transcriptional regulator with XRE-family HTH domain